MQIWLWFYCFKIPIVYRYRKIHSSIKSSAIDILTVGVLRFSLGLYRGHLPPFEKNKSAFMQQAKKFRGFRGRYFINKYTILSELKHFWWNGSSLNFACIPRLGRCLVIHSIFDPANDLKLFHESFSLKMVFTENK